MQFFDYLKQRGYVYQATHEKEIQKILNSEKITFYLGIDPTADSLHIGHFFSLMMFRLLQKQGHRGILVIGGATALVGDPTGKSEIRTMMEKERVAKNVAEVKKLVGRFIETSGDNPALILDNSEWINQFTYVDFMRSVGAFFNVNKMLASEAYSKRLENGGLTFLEMGYMPMQAYDFVYLNRQYDCVLQIGGSDQWGNIVAGTELSRKMNCHVEGQAQKPLTYGLTCPLLMTKDGKKMGKTEKGALWVARDRTTVFDFYQYFYNTPDTDTSLLLKLFTDMPQNDIESLCETDILKAKRVMAYEITALVHGKEEADKVIQTVDSLFYAKNLNTQNMPTAHLSKAECLGKTFVDIASMCQFFPSKSEAKRMIKQGGFMVNGQKVLSEDEKYTSDEDTIVLQKGKKNFLKLILDD